MQKSTFIGIDPGVNNGWAVWDKTSKKLDQLETLSYTETLKRIQGFATEYTKVIIVIEDPSQNRPVFSEKIDGKDKSIALKIAQDVGGNKRGGLILCEWAEAHGIEVQRVRPSTQKWDPKTFLAITKKTGVFSQHARDAAKLVFGF